MKAAKNIFLFTVALLVGIFTNQLFAQGVGNEEVIVVKEYEAKISDAQKINIQPNIPEVQEIKPTLTYSIPPKDFKDGSFEPNNMKPVSMSKEKWDKFNSGFVKIGFGSQIMPIAQLAYNDNHTKNLKFGLFYNHLSAREFKVKNQRFLDDEVGVYLKYYPKTVEFGTNFTFRNYRTHFYGTDSSFEAKNVRQVFRTYDAQVYLRNAQRNKYDLEFNQGLRFNYLQEIYGKANEWFISGNTDIKKTFLKQHSAGFNFNFDVSKLKNDSLSSLQRNIITPTLGYSFNNGDWKAKAYLGLAVDGKKVVFAADVHLEKRFYQQALIGYIDYLHGRRKNSLLTLSQTNNFIHNWVTIENSTVGDLGLGLKGTLQNFSYNLAFHLHHIVNFPFFVNDTLDTKRFLVVYNGNTVIYNFHFESGYNVREWLRLSVVGDYNYYQLKLQTRPWHQPAFKLTFRANYIWKNKVSVGLDVFAATSTYARITDFQERKLKGVADINLSLEYILNKNFAFFGNLNNIANFKYQRWNNYPSYGINGNVGVKFSF